MNIVEIIEEDSCALIYCHINAPRIANQSHSVNVQDVVQGYYNSCLLLPMHGHQLEVCMQLS